ncbi:COG4648 family protein [Salinimonas sediminis]|uniref:COG4648 family protein n=1 Tax=Salinimonas sediminis TaxID=2303538 RepID=UPI0014750997|nr:hypothetical protein [Salinimonas sediminis]
MTIPPKTRGVKDLVPLLAILASVAYPFVVWLNIDTINPRWFGVALLCIAIIRVVFMGSMRRVSDWLLTAIVVLFCAAIILLDSTILLKCYPVMMSASMGLLFLASLNDKQSLIERFASVGGKQLPPEASGYLRRLSLTWGTLLLLNALVAAWTAWYGSLAMWTLYNGLLFYVFIAVFIIAELVYRQYYKKKHNIVED